VHTTCRDRGLSYSKKLCALSDDPFNQTYLSPGDFLIGKPITHLPAADLTIVKCNRFNRWQYFHQQLQQFCQRCSADQLQVLQQRQRWVKTSPNLQPGTLVLLRNEHMTPLQCPTAVFTNIHRHKDGNVRVVTIRTPKGVYKSPITNICPLPREGDDP